MKSRWHVSSPISCQKVYKIICEKRTIALSACLDYEFNLPEEHWWSQTGKNISFLPHPVTQHALQYVLLSVIKEPGRIPAVTPIGADGAWRPSPSQTLRFRNLLFHPTGISRWWLKVRFIKMKVSLKRKQGEGIFHRWHHLNFAMWEARVSFEVCPIKCFIGAGCASILSCIPLEPQPLLLISLPTLTGTPVQRV